MRRRQPQPRQFLHELYEIAMQVLGFLSLLVIAGFVCVVILHH